MQNFAIGCTLVFNRAAAKMYVSHYFYKVDVHDYLMFLICVFMGDVYYDQNSYIKYRQHNNNQIGCKNILDRFLLRIKRFGKSKCFFERHTQKFYDSYKNFFSEKDKKLILLLLDYRRSYLNRLKLLFSNIHYDNIEYNVFMWLKIVLSRL